MALLFIFLLLIIGILGLFFIPDKNIGFLKKWSLTVSGLVWCFSSIIFSNFDTNFYSFQYVLYYTIKHNVLNLTFFLGLDGISLCFFFLSALLIFICILFIWNDKNLKLYFLCLLLVELFLLLVFSALDFLLFYVSFEAILIPMYLIIGVWGSRERKIRAAYLFFFYTLCTSVLMLIGILLIYLEVGTLCLEFFLAYDFTVSEQLFLWGSFFFSFASKIPMYPFHIWLPEAHVEAPTVGSVLLAGILLKLGVYGFIRFILVLFTQVSFFLSPFMHILSIVGVLYASFNAIRQTDLKRIIAYSSIAHMNLVVLGLFSFNTQALEGAIIQSISHGFVSGGIFLLIGIIYERYHTRLLYYYGGVVHMMPIFSVFFLLFTLSNIALPGTSSFVGEFLLLSGIFKINFITSIISATSVVLCGIYSLWLYNKITFGNLKINYTIKYRDLSLREFFVLIPLLIFIALMGLYSSYFSEIIHLSCTCISFILI